MPVLQGARTGPEAARTLILGVGSSSQMFVETAHVPAHVAQTTSPQVNYSLGYFALCLIAHTLLPSLNERWSREQLCPALDHFVHRPTAGARLIDVHDQVIVVLTHREVRNADHVGNT